MIWPLKINSLKKYKDDEVMEMKETVQDMFKIFECSKEDLSVKNISCFEFLKFCLCHSPHTVNFVKLLSTFICELDNMATCIIKHHRVH